MTGRENPKRHGGVIMASDDNTKTPPSAAAPPAPTDVDRGSLLPPELNPTANSKADPLFLRQLQREDRELNRKYNGGY